VREAFALFNLLLLPFPFAAQCFSTTQPSGPTEKALISRRKMDVPLDNADEAIELPSAVSDHTIDLDSGGGGGVDAARVPAQVTSGSNDRDTHLRVALAEGGDSSSQQQTMKRSLSFRIVSEIKNLGRLSNEGIMGAGLARDTDSALKGTCRAILFSVYFEWIILLVIFLNTITMMVKGPDPPGTPSSFASSFAGHSTLGALDVIDLCVTIVFTLEAIFKIWLQGVGQYLSDNYSRFDLASVNALPRSQPNITLTPCCTGYSVVGLRHSRHHRSFLHLWPKSQRNSIVSRRAPAASREILSQFSFYCRSGLSQVGSWIRLCAVLFVGSFLNSCAVLFVVGSFLNSSQVAFSFLSVGSSSMLLCFFIVLYRHPTCSLPHISHLTCSLP